MRLFTVEDVEEVKSLIHRTIDACYPCAYPPNAVAYFKRYHDEEHILRDADMGHMIVVEEGGSIVATGTIVGSHIKRVFVEPALQGRGYGKAIMVYLEDFARRAGIGETDLDASLVSKPFYDALGYEVGKPDSIDVGDGQALDFHRMKKKLR